MAKRKAARAAGRKGAAKVRGGSRTRTAAKKTASSRKTARKKAVKAARRAVARKGAARKGQPRKGGATKAAARKQAARPAKTVARSAKRVARPAKKVAPAKRIPKPVVAAKAAAPPRRPAAVKARQPARSAPGLNRTRRTITDDELVPSPPSSLDMNRSASSVRSGRRELLERYTEHTETSPALTGGDVDADWESAYSVGDEAPGGDNPTPDQDIVDDIGRAVGVQYQDNEELKGEKKIIERDRHRWELDPASSDDWEDR